MHRVGDVGSKLMHSLSKCVHVSMINVCPLESCPCQNSRDRSTTAIILKACQRVQGSW